MDFKDMYNLIDKYQVSLGHDPQSLRASIDYARNMCLGLHQEVAELTDSFPWKPWRPIQDQTYDRNNIKMEIIDCIFFLVGVARAFNISPDELIEKFNEKLKANYARIKSGYNHTNGLKRTEEPTKPADGCEFID